MYKLNFLKLSIIACICAGMVFTGCDKDDEESLQTSAISNPLIVTVENASSYSSVASVRLTDFDSNRTFVSATFTDGGFQVNLPDVDEDYLERMGDDMPSGLKISNPNTMGAYGDFLPIMHPDNESHGLY
jgi:major membrane immunogen (membrane-anchored lipoprotein)